MAKIELLDQIKIAPPPDHGIYHSQHYKHQIGKANKMSESRQS